MSLRDRNRFLQILHRNGTKREFINRILKDVEACGIFDDVEDNEFDDYWLEVEEEANIIFGNMSSQQKKEAFRQSKNNSSDPVWYKHLENRILKKQEEVEVAGQSGRLRGKNKPKELKLEPEIILPYGRTLLHEAIAMRDIEMIEKYAKDGLYVGDKDNNGHTPIEMAKYMGYAEAVKILRKYKKEDAVKVS